LWPEKYYEHALRPDYRKSDRGDEALQNFQRKGYVWSVRIIGVIAAIMFTFILIHLFYRTPNGHGGTAKPVVHLQTTKEKKICSVSTRQTQAATQNKSRNGPSERSFFAIAFPKIRRGPSGRSRNL
jgi:hypothetical protein